MAVITSKFLNRERRTSVRSHDFPEPTGFQPVVVQVFLLTLAARKTFVNRNGGWGIHERTRPRAKEVHFGGHSMREISPADSCERLWNCRISPRTSGPQLKNEADPLLAKGNGSAYLVVFGCCCRGVEMTVSKRKPWQTINGQESWLALLLQRSLGLLDGGLVRPLDRLLGGSLLGRTLGGGLLRRLGSCHILGSSMRGAQISCLKKASPGRPSLGKQSSRRNRRLVSNKLPEQRPDWSH
jgi:hypothetical protein